MRPDCRTNALARQSDRSCDTPTVVSSRHALRAAASPKSFERISLSRPRSKARCAQSASGRLVGARLYRSAAQQLFKLFDCFGLLGADRVVAATGVRSLQSANHRSRNPERCAAVIGFTHEVPLRMGCTVTSKAVPAKSIDDIDGPSFANLCSIFRHVEIEELPIMRCSVEALVMFDHGLGWNQLNH